MSHVFFHSLPSIVFKPIAILAILGGLLALWNHRKHLGALGWFLILALIYMISWRVLAQIKSARYGILLIYPAILGTVYFCFHFGDLLRKLPWKIPEKVHRYLPYALIGILVISCLAKTFRINPYESYLRDGCATVKKDAQHYTEKLLLCSMMDYRRLQYYSGVKYVYDDVYHFPYSFQNRLEFIKCLNRYKKRKETFYVFLDELSGTAPLTAAELNFSEKSWTLLYQNYQNRRKKKMLRIYRWIPSENK